MGTLQEKHDALKALGVETDEQGIVTKFTPEAKKLCDQSTHDLDLHVGKVATGIVHGIGSNDTHSIAGKAWFRKPIVWIGVGAVLLLAIVAVLICLQSSKKDPLVQVQWTPAYGQGPQM